MALKWVQNQSFVYVNYLGLQWWCPVPCALVPGPTWWTPYVAADGACLPLVDKSRMKENNENDHERSQDCARIVGGNMKETTTTTAEICWWQRFCGSRFRRTYRMLRSSVGAPLSRLRQRRKEYRMPMTNMCSVAGGAYHRQHQPSVSTSFAAALLGCCSSLLFFGSFSAASMSR